MKKRIAVSIFFSFALSLPWGAASAGTLTAMSKEGIGSYLADAQGMTLYYFKSDAPGKSTCTGSCLQRWPVFYDGEITPPEGVAAEDFGSIARDDGKKQSTFRGYPLYYFVGDSREGDTGGQGIYSVWFVIDPASFKTK